jgi:hypothetical protein
VDQSIKAHVERRIADAQKSRLHSQIILQSEVIEMGLFTLHLGFEKLLKALYVVHHGKQSPKTHDLLWLHDKVQLELGVEDLVTLTDLNHFFGTMRYDEGLDDPDKEPLTLLEALAFYTESQNLWDRLLQIVLQKLSKLS